MSKVICSPGSYIQGNEELGRLEEYCQKMGSKEAYLLIDKFIYDTYGELIESSFKKKNNKYSVTVFGGECSDSEIKKHLENLGSSDIMIGIGGGKTLDTTKAISFYANKPVIIVPTAASSDAPCSRLAVVYTDQGEFDHYLPLTKNPDMVIMDTNIIAKAPKRFLAAGIGDALATYYEAAACVKSDAITMAGGHITKAAITLAKLCRDTLFEDGLKALAAVEKGVSTKAVENIVEANTYLSGVGFESSGLAAAHAIHNGLTVLEETHRFLHGEKVAFGLICQLVLENTEYEELKKVILFCKECKLPTTFSNLGIDKVTDEKLKEAAIASCDENDTMSNMPFEVTPEDVFAAMKTADQIANTIVK